MLKITRSNGSTANPKETKGKVGSNDMIDNSLVDGSKITNPKSFTKRKNLTKTTKSKILIKFKNYDFSLNFRNIKAGLGFLTPKAKLAFI